jgi:hypothetical protein
MLTRSVGIWLLFGSCLLSSRSATASLLTGPNYIVDTVTQLEVTFTFNAITGNANYDVGPFTSPGGGWGIGQIHIMELDQEATAGIGSDTVSIAGTISDPRTGNNFSYAFNFDVPAAQAGIPGQTGMVGIDGFGAAVQANVSGNDITSYGLGLGAGAGVPEPASIALLLAGGGSLGFIAVRKRRKRRA